MIIPNAQIVEYERMTGSKGDGADTFSAVASISATNPILIELSPVSALMQQNLQARGIRAELQASVAVQWHALIGAEPEVGDRVTLQLIKLGQLEAPEVRRIVDVKTNEVGGLSGGLSASIVMLSKVEGAN